MRLKYFVAIVAITAGLITPLADAQQRVRLIPRHVLFNSPSRANPLISPDGTKISYLAPLHGVMNIWVAPISTPDSANAITKFASRGIRTYSWTHTNHHIVYLHDEAATGHPVVYSVNTTDGKSKMLTPSSATAPDGFTPYKLSARIQQISHKFPAEVLVALNDHDPDYHDIYRINVVTGKRILVHENEDFFGFVTDVNFKVQVAAWLNENGGHELLLPVEDGSWKLVAELPMEDVVVSQPLGLDETGDILYMLDSRGRDKAALVAFNLQTGESYTLAASNKADISNDLLQHPTKNYPQAISSTHARKKWHFLDDQMQADFYKLSKIADGEMSIVSRTLDDQQWIVSFELDNSPMRYYYYNRNHDQLRFLFTNRPELDSQPLAHMSSALIRARDGKELVSYLTLPVGSDQDFDGFPDEPLPMVLNVHGGPWWRDTWGYNSWHQWLANRGYAVLSVNYRGSTGFGKNFVNAGNGQWGGKMQDDLVDAVNWAVQNGIADADRVAIIGGSYGGYAALAGLTFTPEIFACGASIVGPSDLVSFLQTMPNSWAPTAKMWSERVGNHQTEEGRSFLQQISPINFAQQIKHPLMIVRGAHDNRVDRASSEHIVSVMQSNNVPVTYLVYPDEGHGLARPQNQLSFFAITEAFLAQHLGGRYEPINDELVGSSVRIPVGAADVQGVQRALASD